MGTEAAESKRELRVAAVQMNSHDVVSGNLEQCERLLERAAGEGAELAVLPEGFAWLGDESDKAQHAEALDDPTAPIQGALRGFARRFRMTLVAGGMPERSPDPTRPFNSSLVFGPDGQRLAVYRKIHLFDVDLADGSSHRESATTQSGAGLAQGPVVVHAGGVGMGLAICYDLRFPELFRAQVSRGAELLTLPAAFTLHTGRDHWHVLLRARAIENQCWMVAAAQWGRHHRGGEPPRRVSYGHSLIVDPWGTVVAECSDGVGVVTATVSLLQVERVRASVPCLRHRRL